MHCSVRSDGCGSANAAMPAAALSPLPPLPPLPGISPPPAAGANRASSCWQYKLADQAAKSCGRRSEQQPSRDTTCRAVNAVMPSGIASSFLQSVRLSCRKALSRVTDADSVFKAAHPWQSSRVSFVMLPRSRGSASRLEQLISSSSDMPARRGMPVATSDMSSHSASVALNNGASSAYHSLRLMTFGNDMASTCTVWDSQAENPPDNRVIEGGSSASAAQPATCANSTSC